MTCALALMLLLAAPDAPKLVVLDLQHVGAATDAEARSLNDVVVQVVEKTGVFQVISQRDISTLLGVERQKQLMGCGDEAASCLTELSGALDARFVLSGSLNRIGATYQLTLQTLDSRKGQPVGRALRAAKSIRELTNLMPWAVADATGTPAPKAPSRVLPVLLMVAGGLSLAAGGVVLFQTETREVAVQRELDPKPDSDLTSPLPQGLPHTAASYRDDAKDFAANRTASLAFLTVGAALAGAGAFWYLTTPDATGGRVALVPTGPGVALVGAF